MEALSDDGALVDIDAVCMRLFGSDDSKLRQRILREVRLGRIRHTKIGKLVYVPLDEVDRLAAGK